MRDLSQHKERGERPIPTMPSTTKHIRSNKMVQPGTRGDSSHAGVSSNGSFSEGTTQVQRPLVREFKTQQKLNKRSIVSGLINRIGAKKTTLASAPSTNTSKFTNTGRAAPINSVRKKPQPLPKDTPPTSVIHLSSVSRERSPRDGYQQIKKQINKTFSNQRVRSPDIASAPPKFISA